MNFKYMLQSEDAMREEKLIVTQLLPSTSYFKISYKDLPVVERDDLDFIVPVGTVEFVKKYAELNSIRVPENMSYPDELRSFLNRQIYSGQFSDVREDQFCKPKGTKVFTGALKKDIQEAVSPLEPVWISDSIQISSEWRYYIDGKAILGRSRYDQEDNEEVPDESVVTAMIESFTSAPDAYTLDIGTSLGKTFLIEVNDAWAIGYYRWGDMSKESYLKLITDRWTQIVNGGVRKR